jgi:hypothetical protein
MDGARVAEQEYRQAFDQFSKHVQLVQGLTAQANTDPKAMEKALLELETAHVNYAIFRDRWVQHLLPSPAPKAASKSARGKHSHEDCIRAIAELLWVSAGRPDGTAAEDWRKAEAIVKQAAAAA